LSRRIAVYGTRVLVLNTDKVMVAAGDTPDDTARAILADLLPEKPLDQFPLNNSGDLVNFLIEIITRRRASGLELDEVEAFVRLNRDAMRRNGLPGRLPELLERFLDMPEVASATAVVVPDRAAFRDWAADVATQIQHVMDGHSERFRLLSTRLQALCLALELHVTSGLLPMGDAAGWLRRPDMRRRITAAAADVLALDYQQGLDQGKPERPEYAVIIGECALLSGDPIAAVLVGNYLRATRPPDDRAAWLDLRERVGARLRREGLWTADDEADLQAARTGFASTVPDDDF
jgi:hypothetical protein